MRTRALVVTMTLAGALTGCGQDAPPEPSPPPPAPAPPVAAPTSSAPDGGWVELNSSPTIARIQQRRTLLVGVRADEPQYAVLDPAGEYRGFDVEIARDLARRLGLDAATQVQFRRLPPNLMRSAATGGNVDLLLGADEGPEMTRVGPYAVTDSPRYVVIKSDDPKFAEELHRMLDASVADGSWQRAYDTTLAPAGIRARPR